MAVSPFYWVNGQKVKLTLFLKFLPKGTNLEEIGLIYSSNLCHNHGNFMAHSQKWGFFPPPKRLFKILCFLGPFFIPHLYSNLENFLIRKHVIKSISFLICLQVSKHCNSNSRFKKLLYKKEHGESYWLYDQWIAYEK